MSFLIVDNMSTMSGSSLRFVVAQCKGAGSSTTVRRLVSKYRAPVAFGPQYRVLLPGDDSQASELSCTDVGMMVTSGHSGSRSEVSSGLGESEGMIVGTY